MSESKNKTIPFKISLKKLKYLGINLSRLQSVGLQRVGHDWVTEQQQKRIMKDLYAENDKALIRERWYKEVERYSLLLDWKN